MTIKNIKVNIRSEFICEYDGVYVFAIYIDNKFKELFYVKEDDHHAK